MTNNEGGLCSKHERRLIMQIMAEGGRCDIYFVEGELSERSFITGGGYMTIDAKDDFVSVKAPERPHKTIEAAIVSGCGEEWACWSPSLVDPEFAAQVWALVQVAGERVSALGDGWKSNWQRQRFEWMKACGIPIPSETR